MEFSTDNEEEIGRWFQFTEIFLLITTSQLCDKVQIKFQSICSGDNLSALHYSCHKTGLKEKDLGKCYKSCVHIVRCVSVLYVY